MTHSVFPADTAPLFTQRQLLIPFLDLLLLQTQPIRVTPRALTNDAFPFFSDTLTAALHRITRTKRHVARRGHDAADDAWNRASYPLVTLRMVNKWLFCTRRPSKGGCAHMKYNACQQDGSTPSCWQTASDTMQPSATPASASVSRASKSLACPLSE